MTMAQTSDRVSSIAAQYWGMSNTHFKQLVATASEEDLNRMAYDMRSMAASLMRQDETKGLRGLVKKVFG